MFKNWPIAILGLYVLLLLLLTISLVMAWNDGIKFSDIIKRKPTVTVLAEPKPVELPEVEPEVVVRTVPRAVEEPVVVLPPLPTKKPVKVKRTVPKVTKLRKRKPKMRKVCWQTKLDKMFNTCWKEEWVPAH